MKKCKILVLGFDGLDYEIFRDYTRHNLHIAPMHSALPFSGPAWTSIYAGDSALTHGVKDVWGRECRPRHYFNNTVLDNVAWGIRRFLGVLRIKYPIYSCNTYHTTKSKYIWDILSKNSYSVKIVNVPITYPPKAVNGIQIAGFPLEKGKSYAYPKNLRLPDDYYEISDIIQRYLEPLKVGIGAWKQILSSYDFSTLFKVVRRDSYSLLSYFKNLDNADFQMMQFSFVDRLGHVFGMNKGTMEIIYGLVDDLINEMLNNIECDNLFIISDHGFKDKDHTDNGVLAFRGNDLVGNINYQGKISVKDFTPTVLKIFDIDYKCDGHSVSAILKGEKPEDYQETDNFEAQELREKELIESKLKELGYF